MTRPSAHLSSHLILADADRKSAGVLAFGFERAGATVVQAASADDLVKLASEGKGEVIVLSMTPALGLDALRTLREQTAAGKVPAVAVVALGAPEDRAAALAAGATDYLDQPAFVRDVVTLARLLASRKDKASGTLSGELVHHDGIFHLIRAISSAGRTGVLTVLRGMRRGEIRYYQGEVTSAQVGTLHGIAGLHQLLLWTEGRFDFRSEAVVRRQQIPLSPADLLEDCGRFVRDFQQIAGKLAPGAVYEQDLRRVAECVEKIPKEVGPVLRLFDGGRTLADVVEDSPFRVFDTVKIAGRLLELGTLRILESPRPRTGAAMALSVDDWRVGDSTPSLGVPILIGGKESEPIGPRPGEPASPPEAFAVAGDADAPQVDASVKKKRKKERQEQRAAAELVPNVDWGKLPTGGGIWETPGFAPVVPSQVVAGEISERPAARPSPDVSLASAAVAVARDLAVATPTAGGAMADTALGSTGALMVTSDATPVDHLLPVVEGMLAGPQRERLVQVLDQELREGAVADGPLEKSNGTAAIHDIVATPAIAAMPDPAAPIAPMEVADSLENALAAAVSKEESASAAAITAPTPLAPPAEPAAVLAPPTEPAPIEALPAVVAPAPATATLELRDDGLFEKAADTAPFDLQSDTVPFEKPGDTVPFEKPADTAPFELAPPVAAAPALPPVVPVVEPLAAVSGELVSAAVRALPPVSGELAAVVSSHEPQVLVAPVLPPAVQQQMEQAVVHTASDASDAAIVAAHVAAGFDNIEAEFFSQEGQFANAAPPPVDHFEDLNDGALAPTGFWKRLFGGKPQPTPQANRPARPATPVPVKAAGSTTPPQKPASSSSPPAQQPRKGQSHKPDQKHRKRR